MGQTCCRSKLDEGITYEEDYYKDFYQFNNPQNHEIIENKNFDEVQNKISFTKAKPNNSFKLTETKETNNINQSMSLLRSFNDNSNIINIVNLSDKDKKEKETINITPSLDNPNTNNINTTTQIQPQRSSIKKHVNFKSEPNGILENNKDNKEDITTLTNSTINLVSFLTLIVKESKHLNKDETLKINQLGLVGTKRVQGNDKNVIFGHRKFPEDNTIDVSMHQEEGIAEKHFEIKYDKTLNKYFVHNVKHSGVFIKIIKNMQLRDGMIISFGTNHIHVSIINKPSTDQREVPSIIKFKAIYGSNKGQEV